MSNTQTFEEARAYYIERLGGHSGPVFHELLNDYWSLRLQWADYVELFGTSKKRIDLMNQASGRVCGLIQDRVLEGTLLHLCRLTDPPVQGRAKHRNLSLGALPIALRKDGHVLPGLEGLIRTAEQSTKFARAPRDKHLSHRSLPHALGEAKQVTLGSRRQVNGALSAIFAPLVCVARGVAGEDLLEDPFGHGDGAQALLFVIRDGLRARDARLERIRSGRFTPQDFHVEPLD